MVQYLIRLDDLCPTNNLQKWDRFYQLFDRYGIKPIIAVIPDNKDPKLEACGNFNPDYWQLVRNLQQKAYIIAIHGYEHRYQNNKSGLLKLNKRSEFAGLPRRVQEQKIRAAVDIFKREGVHSKIFIAPAHTFDYNTILALAKHSEIQIISDGLLKSPYMRFGFKWIPVQLSEATVKAGNTWTFNYHPETCTDKEFKKLESFIEQHHSHFVSLSDLTFKQFTLTDYLYEQGCIYYRLLRGFAKSLLLSLKTSVL
jgi:hypothetical protein